MSDSVTPWRSGFFRRLASAVRRRARALRSRLSGVPLPPEEQALCWLLAGDTGEGLPASTGTAACPRFTVAALETVLNYGCRSEALRWARWLRSRAGVPEWPDAEALLQWALSSNTPSRRRTLGRTYARTARRARLAALWYQAGKCERAERALRGLERYQRRDGSFPAEAEGIPDPWTAKYYLDAALERVRASFERHWQAFPESIDADDGRMEAVFEWFATLPPDAYVVDLGCGKGRFLRPLRERFPAARLVGLDISPAMLAALPPGVTPQEGSLLRTGLADASFDGALAIESLEHALVPQRAVAEMCRLVRPGGRVLVIDKDRRRQPLSLYEPWERWFLAEELLQWLQPYCDELTVQHVAHREGRPGRDLFLAVVGRRK